MRRQDRAGNGARPARGRRLLTLLLLAALAALVLRSPLDVVTMLTPSAATSHSPSPSSSPEPATDGLATVGGGTAPTPDGPVGSGRAGGDGDPSGTDGRWGAPAPRPTTELLLEELRGGWRLEGGVEEAAALAVVAAHAWAEADGSLGDASRAAKGAIVVVEAVEQPGAHHAVITLLISVDSELRRIAVPVHVGPDGAAIAGAPWSLPAPTMRVEPVEGTAIGDAELIGAARRALTAVGIDGDRLRALEVTDGWPFIARLEDATEGDPWLRWHVDRFVVTGLPLRAAKDGRETDDAERGG